MKSRVIKENGAKVVTVEYTVKDITNAYKIGKFGRIRDLD
jgi:hypothetical protein